MHEIPIAQPALCLTTDLAFLSIFELLGDEVWRKVLDQVLEDGARLSEHNRLGAVRCGESDDRRFPKRMDFLQFRRSLHLLSLVDLDGVIDARAFLEQPYDTLSARVVEPVHNISMSRLLGEVFRTNARRPSSFHHCCRRPPWLTN